MSSKKEYTVKHPSLYLRVSGKLQEQKVGDKLSLTEEQAVNMLKKGMIDDPKKAATKNPKGAQREAPEVSGQ